MHSSRQKLESIFPNLRHTPFSIESEIDPSYNCIAYAANDKTLWWWPGPGGYWPRKPREETLQCFISTFEDLGYKICSTRGYELGFEKVAIYVDNHAIPTHMARQIGSGVNAGEWASKCGGIDDIFHTLEGLEGPKPAYGTVAQIMKRSLIL